ncbi:MAG: endonuclease domain-containing protein [Polyangia bacterium]
MEIQKLAREMRNSPTEAEDALWQRLRSRGLAGLKFRRQHAIGRIVIDFYCPEKRLAVEVEGGVHAKSSRCEKDEQRRLWLEERGIRVVTVQNEDVFDRMADVLELIGEAAVEEAHTPRPPFPPAGKGESERRESEGGMGPASDEERL